MIASTSVGTSHRRVNANTVTVGASMRKTLAALLAAVSLTACTGGHTPPPPSKAQQNADAYRSCVGTDKSKRKQDTCQMHVWGETFGEDDSRWICDRMGNWLCEIRTDKKL